MPCYNSLAADRYADELGRESAIDDLVAREQAELVEAFDAGEDLPLIPVDEIIDRVLCDPHIARLIKAAWSAGTYRELGEDIHRELLRQAEQFADASADELRDHYERHTDAQGRYEEVP